jgi:hypothetical protein
MTTLEQIKKKTRELQQSYASGVHRQDIQDEIQGLYAHYRAERAGAAPPAPPVAPPKKHWSQRGKDLDAGAPPRARKLTEEQVIEIRERWAAEGGRRGIQRELCRKYGVHPVTMGDIVHGRSYRHLL